MKLYHYSWLHGSHVYSLEVPHPQKVSEIKKLIYSQRRMKRDDLLVLLNTSSEYLLPYDDDEIINYESFKVKRMPRNIPRYIIHIQKDVPILEKPILERLTTKRKIEFIQEKMIPQKPKLEKLLITCEVCGIDIFNEDRKHVAEYQNWSSAPCGACAFAHGHRRIRENF